MKKNAAVFVILLGLLSFNASASAFFSWGDIKDTFKNSFIGKLFHDDSKEKKLLKKNPEKILPKNSKDNLRLQKIQKELKILQEGGVEALKKYEKLEKFSENTQKTLQKIKQKDRESIIETTENPIPNTLPEIEIPMNFTCSTVTKTFPPTGKYYFSKLPFGSQNRHTEILRYKIKWFDGTWSKWFIPGKNDKDWRGDRHFWANFADHQYEIEHCENYQYSPPE